MTEGKDDGIPNTTLIDNQPRPETLVAPLEFTFLQVEVIGGPMDGERRRVAAATISIGRGEPNDLPLPLDLMISSAHARIVREGHGYWLEDLSSSNGTFVGDERITDRVPIAPGTLFVVGRTCLEFMPA